MVATDTGFHRKEGLSMYEVVYPLGRLTQNTKPLTSRLDTLDGVTICELSNHKYGSQLTFAILEKVLSERYRNVKFISHEEFGDIDGHEESDVFKALPNRLRTYGCDAVVSGNGG